VGLDRRQLDDQRFGDLRVRQTLRDQLEHLPLARRQLGEAGIVLVAEQRRHRDPVDQAARDRGRQQRLSFRDRVDSRDELLGRAALEQETAGAGAQGAEDVLVGLEGREDQDPHLGRHREQLGGRGDTVELRHAHVHQHHVGAAVASPVHGLAAVLRLVEDLDRVVARQDRAQAAAQELVVVDEHDSDSLAHSLARS
jgi:hypothetical protein